MLLSIIFVLTNCKTQSIAYFPNAEIEYIETQDNLVTFRILGYGINEDDAITNAQINGFDNIFFRGIPNTANSNPLIGYNEREVKQKHQNFFNSFYRGRRMLNFINRTTLISSDKSKVLAKKIKKRSVVLDDIKSIAAYVELTYNMKSLRKDLEDKNVIKAFGF